MGLLTRGMHHIERHPRHIGDHDGAVGGLALHLGRARHTVAFGAGNAICQQFLLHGRDNITVFCVHHGQGPNGRAAAEAVEQLVILHHQRALIGHEVLEGVDAMVDHHLHLVKDLLTPPCHRHVERIIRAGAFGFRVPGLQRLQHRLTGAGQAEIDHHGGATCKSRAGAGFKIIRRMGAHKGHLQMHMRINSARHHITPLSIQHFAAAQVLANLDDFAAFNGHIRVIATVGGHNGAALDYGSRAHCLTPRFLRSRGRHAAAHRCQRWPIRG